MTPPRRIFLEVFLKFSKSTCFTKKHLLLLLSQLKVSFTRANKNKKCQENENDRERKEYKKIRKQNENKRKTKNAKLYNY